MGAKCFSENNLKFLLYDVFDAVSLTQYPYYQDHGRDIFDMVIDTADKIGRDIFLPNLKGMDEEMPELVDGQVKVHPSVREIVRACGEGGWISANASSEVGGQQLPIILTLASNFILSSYNYAASCFPFLTSGAAHLIECFAAKEMKDTYLPKMYSGEWQGTMALTEPQAGSSLADVSTVAEPDDNGYYKIRGQKIFTSAGDHDGVDNVIHLLLAKIPGSPPGVKGISLFIVPKKRLTENDEFVSNDVNVAGVFHKLGYRGSPITQLSFGESDDCRGFLVGEENLGLTYMFQMMNEARIEVGLGAAAIASAAYHASLEYSRERLQGRKIGVKDLNAPQIPIIEHADIKRMLLFQRAVVEGSLSLLLQCAKYADLAHVMEGEEKEKYDLLLDLLTPIAKTYPSEMGILSVSQGLQCLGGYGYCDEFPLEQYYRDVRIHPIHEGTTAIQGIDILGRKVVMKNGKAFTLFIEEVNRTISRAKTVEGLSSHAGELDEALRSLKDITSHLTGIAAGGKLELALSDATLYIELFGIVCIAWQWLVQALVAQKALEKDLSEEQKNFYEGKLFTCRYFFGYELLKTEWLLKRLKKDDGLTIKMAPELFSD